jgi:hypothetical protein
LTIVFVIGYTLLFTSVGILIGRYLLPKQKPIVEEEPMFYFKKDEVIYAKRNTQDTLSTIDEAKAKFYMNALTCSKLFSLQGKTIPLPMSGAFAKTIIDDIEHDYFIRVEYDCDGIEDIVEDCELD